MFLAPNDFLLFCSRTAVSRISLNTIDNTDVVVVKNQRNAIATDYLYSSKLMFWTDVASDVIMSSTFDGTKITTVGREKNEFFNNLFELLCVGY